MSSLVCIGQIVNVHGIKGGVKIKPALNNPMTICDLGPLTDSKGQRLFDLTSCHMNRDCVVVTLKGIDNRSAADALKGVELYVSRDVLPAASDDEFYYCDLVGMSVFENGILFGTVQSVENYGAGDILQIKTVSGKAIDFAFTEATFPHVDIAEGKIEIVRPIEMNGDVDED